MNANIDHSLYNRNEYIDILKSFLIMTVVLGHVLVAFFPGEYIFRQDFKIIYSFHMFLFIFISGYLVQFVKRTINFNWIKRRFIRLMCPYIIWTLIFQILHQDKISIGSYFMELIAPSYWFLIILFLCDAIYYIISNIFVDMKRRAYIAIILSVAVMLLWWSTKNIVKSTDILHMYSIYLPFYFLGVFSSSYQDKMVKFIKRFGLGFWLLYPIAMTLYTYQNHDFFISFVNGGILSKWGWSMSANMLNTISVLYNHFIVAPLGMIFWGMLIYKMYQLKFIGLYFSYIGRYTLVIYIIEGWFFLRYTGNVFMDVILSTVFGILMPIIFAKVIVRVSPRLHYLLFGSYH